MIPAQTIAYLCIVVGLSMIAGWWVAFRNRPYLGLLGASFLVLAAYLTVRERVAANPAMMRVQIAVLALYVVLVAAAVVAAVQESRRRLAEVREHFRAAEEGFVAMMEAEQRRRAAEAKGDSSPPPSDKEEEQ